MNINLVDELPKSANELPVFATKEFLNIRANGNLSGYFTDKELAIPFYIHKVPGFKRLKFTNTIINLNSTEKTENEQKQFLDEVVHFIKDKSIADYITAPMAHCVFNVIPDKSNFTSWGSYIIDLKKFNGSEDGILSSYKHEFRRKLKKAKIENIKVTETYDIKGILELLKHTFERSGSPFEPSEDFMVRLTTEMKDYVKLYAAYKENEMISCLIIIYNKFGAYAFYSGTMPNGYGGMNIIYHYAIRDLSSKGIPTLDLMGTRLIYEKNSKYAGIQQFKRTMKGDLKKGYFFSYVINPIKYRLFKSTAEMYFKLKGKKFEMDIVEQINKLEKRIAENPQDETIVRE